jgi:hypothetical protein
MPIDRSGRRHAARSNLLVSTSPDLDCGGSNAAGASVQGPLQITPPTGGTGYVCYVSGTFL